MLPGHDTVRAIRSKLGGAYGSNNSSIMGGNGKPDRGQRNQKCRYTSKPQGTGMGLRISRSIIESHGGWLWATPNTGPGATFQFVLPIEPSTHQIPLNRSSVRALLRSRRLARRGRLWALVAKFQISSFWQSVSSSSAPAGPLHRRIRR